MFLSDNEMKMNRGMTVLVQRASQFTAIKYMESMMNDKLAIIGVFLGCLG